MIKGFIFDLDGVIAETAVLHYEAWKQEVSKIGINLTEKVNATLKGLSRMETLNGILEAYNVSISEKEKILMSNNKNKEYLKMLNSKLSPKDILPNMEKIIIEAKKAGLKMAIASSSKNAPLILKKLSLLDYFDFIVNPNDIKHGKPRPDIYLAAAKGINLKPCECIGFEDSMPGVEGLLSAKIPTIAITHGDEGDWHKANFVVDKTVELNYQYILNFFKH